MCESSIQNKLRNSKYIYLHIGILEIIIQKSLTDDKLIEMFIYLHQHKQNIYKSKIYKYAISFQQSLVPVTIGIYT